MLGIPCSKLGLLSVSKSSMYVTVCLTTKLPSQHFHCKLSE